MAYVMVLLAMAVLAGVALLAAGYFEGLRDVAPDWVDSGLPDGPLRAGDVSRLRFPVVWFGRGYRMEHVDAVLTRIQIALAAAE
ncbi:MAG TPA: DivIVA domain-containing protein, partial [Mycobacteriales bacterium]|nr:DivIVA domain-containing protein [Mycobacteriales bacterium]